MEYKKIDEIYEKLQVRCAKCNTQIKSVLQAKSKIDKYGKNVVLCLDCSKKYQEEYRDLTQEELTESSLSAILAMFVLGENKD